MIGRMMLTCSQRDPLNEPICQNTICSRACVGALKTMNEIAAPATALTATPVRMRVTTSVRPFARASM
jgi:hypothetical protein